MLPFLEAELDPPSAFVRTMIGLLFTAFPAFVDNSKIWRAFTIGNTNRLYKNETDGEQF